MATSTIQSSNWKYLGEKNGSDQMLLPSDWEEVHLEAGVFDSGGSGYLYTSNALRNGMPDNGNFYYTGDYRVSNANHMVVFFVNKTRAFCNFFFENGVSNLENIKFRAWYR